MSDAYVIAPDGTPERLIQRLENASSDEIFCCEADREEAVEIAQEEFATALAEAEARGRRQGLEEAATRCDEEATAVEAALANELGLAVICVSPETRRLRRLRNEFRSLATTPVETQKPETGESAHG